MTELIVAHLADGGLSMGDYTVALKKVFTYIVRSWLKTRIAFADCYPASKLPAPTGKAMEIFDPVNEMNNIASVYDDGLRFWRSYQEKAPGFITGGFLIRAGTCQFPPLQKGAILRLPDSTIAKDVSLCRERLRSIVRIVPFWDFEGTLTQGEMGR